ncbi:MAG: (2Fe-2S)-binding protein [Pseudomonadota bacterium]
MYVCICNALKQKQLEGAARDDARSVAEVFRKCGTKPQCGKCLPDVADMIDTARSADAPIPAVAAE